MKQNKIRTIFIGTPDFGIPSLKSLLNSDKYEIVGVITQPDKKKGRKQTITPPPIKTLSFEYGIQAMQPNKINDTSDRITKMKPDLIVVIAYAQIIPEEILNIPKYGAINIHGSLLPKYRGASCIQASILNGDKKTGITIMKMDKGLDTGPIISQHSIPIENNDTAESVFDKLSELAGKTIVPVLNMYISGAISPIAQNNKNSSYVGLLHKEDGKIDWKNQASYIERFVRAMFSWPGAFSMLDNKILKIISVENKILNINKYKTGEIFPHNGKLAVQCTDGAVVLDKIQLSGKKIMNSRNFLLGHSDLVGKILR